jgi:hypothetical protein
MTGPERYPVAEVLRVAYHRRARYVVIVCPHCAERHAHPWPLSQPTIGARVAGCALRHAMARRRSEVLAYWIPLPDAEGAP